MKELKKMKKIEIYVERNVKNLRFKDEEKKEEQKIIEIEGEDVGYVKGKKVMRNVKMRIENEERIEMIG